MLEVIWDYLSENRTMTPGPGDMKQWQLRAGEEMSKEGRTKRNKRAERCISWLSGARRIYFCSYSVFTMLLSAGMNIPISETRKWSSSTTGSTSIFAKFSSLWQGQLYLEFQSQTGWRHHYRNTVWTKIFPLNVACSLQDGSLYFKKNNNSFLYNNFSRLFVPTEGFDFYNNKVLELHAKCCEQFIYLFI